MNEYGEAMYYKDVNSDLSVLREKLLNSLLELPQSCFFRATPNILSEKMFGTDEILYRAFYRYSEIKLNLFESAAYGLGELDDEE